MKYNEEHARTLIGKVKWIWAKTYLSVPHEYIVRGKCGLTDEDFRYLVIAQREYGIHEQWHKYNFPYLYLDGYKYWTMGDAVEETIILNRQKVFSEFDSLDSQEQIISRDLCKTVSELYNSMFHGRAVYECGCGYGTSIKDFGFQLYQYRGIDPSKKAIAKFKDNHPDFVNRVYNMSFEESVNYWSKGDAVVLATYGTASYFMHQYLEILGKSGQDFFLMFYKDKYCPQIFQDMHHFSYSDDYLRFAFPNSNIMSLDTYRFVSSKEFLKNHGCQ